MSDVAVIEPRPALVAGKRPQAIVPHDLDGAYRLAKAICAAGMAPRGMETPEKCMIAIMRGMEVGLTPFMALDKIAIVNGRPMIWGDGALGLVRGSGLCEYVKETIEGADDARIAVCEVKRRGEPEPIRRMFSVADAKKASLWGKAGPWQQYQERMLQMRARAFALRDGFADVLGGLYIREEVDEASGIDTGHRETASSIGEKLAAARTITPPGNEAGFSQEHVVTEIDSANSNSSQHPASSPDVAETTPASVSPADAGTLSQAKATEGKAGMAVVHDDHVRRSTAGTGLQVGEAGADQPATSEFMDVTAGETAPNSDLPAGWQGIYAQALTRDSKKPKSLATRRTEALEIIGGTPSGSDLEEMQAMDDLVKRRNTGALSPADFKAALREIMPAGVEI